MRRLLQKRNIRPCKEWYLKVCAIVFGVTSTLLLTIAIATNHWIYMEESMDLTDQDVFNLSHDYYPEPEDYQDSPDGDRGLGTATPGQMELELYDDVEVRVHSGLWRVCVLYEEDYADVASGIGCIVIVYYGQVWNRIEGADTIFSILRAMRRSAFAIVISLLVMFIAQIVGTVGIIKRNILTLVGGVLMIIAALFLGTGLVFYITAVNDEVGHRKKPRLGEDPTFYYRYSWGFIFSAVAYLGANMAAVANIYLYQKRFNQRFEDLAEIVPGLEGIIAEVRQSYHGSNVNGNGHKEEMFVAESPVIVV